MLRRQLCLAMFSMVLFSGICWADDDTDTAPPTLKVLVMPSEVKIFNITAGGSLDIAADGTAAATAETDTATQRDVPANARLQMVTMPTLSADEQATLKEHLALYKLAASQANQVRALGGDWHEVLENFDYSVGPGLQFLKQRTGADAALVVFGADGESTGGRVAMGIFLAALGVGIAGGSNYLYAGIIDLNTGNIIWLDNDRKHVMSNFSNMQTMDLVVAETIHDYPYGSIHGSGPEPKPLPVNNPSNP